MKNINRSPYVVNFNKKGGKEQAQITNNASIPNLHPPTKPSKEDLFNNNKRKFLSNKKP